MGVYDDERAISITGIAVVICRTILFIKPGFHSNAIACVACVAWNFHATNAIAPANRNARSKQWQPWFAACQRKRLRFLRFSFTQRTQRKRLRLNGNRAWCVVWTCIFDAQLLSADPLSYQTLTWFDASEQQLGNLRVVQTSSHELVFRKNAVSVRVQSPHYLHHLT